MFETVSMQKVANDLRFMLEKNIFTNDMRDLLGQSLLYYCSGKDPTPIAAFGAQFPLYVYIDIAKESMLLYERLGKIGFEIKQTESLQLSERLKHAKNAELSICKTPSKECILLLFVQADAVMGYRDIYQDMGNYIQPKCFCNFRYEMTNREIFDQAEKRVQFILGYCFDSKYREVAEFDYMGDYEKDTKVKLYQRFYYYLY